MVYVDTSALVPLFIRESSTDTVIGLAQGRQGIDLRRPIVRQERR
jgi:predicted nucleic acid-binding protein